MDVPEPWPDPDGRAWLRDQVRRAEFFDLRMIQGKLQIRPPFPFSPAAESRRAYSTVCPALAHRSKPGDRVVPRAATTARVEKMAACGGIFHRQDSRQSGFRPRRGIIIITAPAALRLEGSRSLKAGKRKPWRGCWVRRWRHGPAACELGKLIGLLK